MVNYKLQNTYGLQIAYGLNDNKLFFRHFYAPSGHWGDWTRFQQFCDRGHWTGTTDDFGMISSTLEISDYHITCATVGGGESRGYIVVPLQKNNYWYFLIFAVSTNGVMYNVGPSKTFTILFANIP